MSERTPREVIATELPKHVSTYGPIVERDTGTRNDDVGKDGHDLPDDADRYVADHIIAALAAAGISFIGPVEKARAEALTDPENWKGGSYADFTRPWSWQQEAGE